ncbi:MAG: site-specific DNA-methyltransferase, partial [Pseudomonadota bacterium]
MADKYSTYSKDDLIRLLRERERKPKFGLVWERDEIDHDKSVNGDFIALDLVPELSCGEAPYSNLLIEGDNFDALRYLRMTHAGQVKCIYIDPPYNTGNKDFIYNDHFIDKDDLYKHSKWLEYMYRRLVLARDLLREDGVIFVSIGEDEFANLTLLMDQVFSGMKVGTFVWRRRSGANDPTGYFTSTDHEYVICYANPNFSFQGLEKDFSSYSNFDENSQDPWKRGDLTKAHTYKQRKNAFYPIQNPRNGIWYACNPNTVWRFATEKNLKPGQKTRSPTMENHIKNNKVLFPANDKPVQYSGLNEIVQAIRNGTAPKGLGQNNSVSLTGIACHPFCEWRDGVVPVAVKGIIPNVDIFESRFR